MFFGGPVADYAEQQARNGAEANLALEVLRKELEQTRKELADYKTQQNEQHRADRLDAIKQYEKGKRHDVYILFLSVLVSKVVDIVVEHWGEIAEFVIDLIS